MGRLARLAVGLGLTVLALWLADPAAVWRAGAAARPGWIAAAVGLVALDRALMAGRWIALVRAIEPFDAARGGRGRVPRPLLLRTFFVSTFVGTFLPSVGGDAARALSLARHEVSAADAAASVVMDRLLGLWSLLLVACVSLWGVEAARRDAGVLVTLTLAGAGCAAAAMVLFSDRAAAAVVRLIGLLPGVSVRHAAGRLLGSMRRYRAARGALVTVTVASIAVQLLRVLQAWCLGRALGIAASFAVYLALIPIILLVMLLPVTVNGLGTSQLAFVWLFGTVDVPEPQAFALSVLFVALGAVGNLPGGVMYAFGGRVRPPIAEIDRSG